LGFWINLQAAAKILLSIAFFVVSSVVFGMISSKGNIFAHAFFLSSYLALKPPSPVRPHRKKKDEREERMDIPAVIAGGERGWSQITRLISMGLFQLFPLRSSMTFKYRLYNILLSCD
jgi:hypothetical protein